MRLLQWAKDGGPKSHSDGLFIIELRRLCSIVLLHFRPGAREAYHNHAFNTWTWFLKGEVREYMLDGAANVFKPSLKPKITPRSTFHRVFSIGHTWAISFRGPWVDQWKEFIPETNEFITLTHGRRIV